MNKKPYHIATKRQITAFINPIRGDIFQWLATLGPLSARQIAADLDIPVTSLYNHLQYLVAVGLVKAVQSSPKSAYGRPALTYDAVACVVHLSEEIEKPGHGKLVGKTARAAATQASHDFNVALGAPSSVFRGEKKNIAFFRTLALPSRSTLRRINTLLDELREISSTSRSETGPLISFTWFMAPVRRRKKSVVLGNSYSAGLHFFP